MKITGIRDDIETNASNVNEFILSSLEGKPKELYSASAHYIATGGKRLRPFIVIKSCEMFGGSAKTAMPAAAAVELVHNFSLVHDDIMDNDNMRHNVPTVHTSYGIPLAILAGDVLFSKAFQLLSVRGRKEGITERSLSEMVSRLSTACIRVCEGQAIDMQMASETNKVFSEDDYIDMIEKKTAALFKLSCSLGVLSSNNLNNKDLENLSIFGKNIGIAFQLIDDLIGIVGDPRLTGKAVGNDIREGKKTYPMILALKRATEDNKNKILKVFGSRKISNAELNEATRTISTLNIDEDTRILANSYIGKALGILDEYGDSDAKKALESSANFIVQRSM